MIEKATVKGIEITAKEWEGYGKKKIYFSLDKATCGSAKANKCEWDCAKKDFIYRTRDSFLGSPALNNKEALEWEESIKSAFNL